MTITIGLTGGIGSGKSTVARLFAGLNIPVYDTDLIARDLVSPGKPALQELSENLGNAIITKTGELDRAVLKKMVFENDAVREKVESILHPKIRQELLSNIASCDAAYCIAVIPLLIEKKWHDVVDRILVVDLPEEMQLSRASSRDNVSAGLISQIMQTQADRAARLAHADDVIDNSQDENYLAEQVKTLHEKYLAIASKR